MTELVSPLPDGVKRAVEDPARLQALGVLTSFSGKLDADFERLSRVAARMFGTEFGLVTLVGKDRQWFRGCFGPLDFDSTETNISFCAHTISLPEQAPLVVLDTLQDDRFRNNVLVTESPHIRFYAGAPIIIGGHKVGSLCVLSAQERSSVEPDFLAQLTDLANVASALFALKDEALVRARTAAALKREEWRHALTLEAGKVGSWVWDIPSGEIACNDMFRRMYQLPETGHVHADDVMALLHDDDRPQVEARLTASLTDGVDYRAEARVKLTGRWLSMRGRVYQRDAQGKPLIMMGAVIDISENRQTAEHTRLLLRELNHRVKNTLAMIQSVARQTIRQNPDPRAFIDAFSGRLRTISDAHVLLADRDWSGVHLYEVLASQLGPNFLTKPDRAEVKGEDIALPADHALGLGLILHELTTNAHRYGAWSTERGVVRIHWDVKQAPERGLALRWEEIGGPAVQTPKEYGLGAKLIERSLAKVLDSKVTLNFEPTGVVTDVWLPLPA
ncbi:MAG TPA: HWE histidine kinase domain-containing protein [Devosia sp.]